MMNPIVTGINNISVAVLIIANVTLSIIKIVDKNDDLNVKVELIIACMKL